MYQNFTDIIDYNIFSIFRSQSSIFTFLVQLSFNLSSMSFYLFTFSGPDWNSQRYFPQLIGKDCGPFPFPDEALTEMFVGLCGLGDFVQVTEYEVFFF